LKIYFTIKIGNSRGIRIPKSIIEQSGLNDEVELEVRNDQIIIKSISKTKRENWDILFKKMAQNKDDILLDSDTLTEQTNWDKDEWVW
jgi:antitoxin MazE